MLIDSSEITVKAGKGGSGIVSFGKMMGSGPDGGIGGDGGDVYFVASADITLLNQFSQKKSFSAEDGQVAEKSKMSGKDGADLEITIPVGTTIIDKRTREVIFELTKVGERRLIAKGGKGGLGNHAFRSPTRTTPRYAQPGLAGEEKKLILTLRLIADFGLIGLPNAGKTSLLNELTNSKAKASNYPFTTLWPNLGICNGLILADIPGLIEGASEGRGLGTRFLKHIEKVEVLIHCISAETENVTKDYKTIRKELSTFNKALVDKTEIILLTKTDLVDSKKLNSLVKKLKKLNKEVYSVSIHDWDSMEKLKKLIKKIG